MSETGGAQLPEGQGMDEASDNLPPESEADRRTAQLQDIERDLDTVDSALAALDSDDLEGAEALAAELEESAG
ncbi:MAG: hypothetical protein F4110_01615 [Acidimicrobiaceae bacterium]|nr:hypothetical protein [Acidimicrobiaceae bacterium]MXZ97664.1 hypothetical protein [Acidimicrobiaceae bacterium]MYE77020.1 hypothetical protein [Acidimicrobiaceae bacterium]MYE97294.1 hypothetical protein [Acidimicrobiaceae bacterium]MYH43802.1 hypothetical protein [Acidimicrobiaceae bacterium]